MSNYKVRLECKFNEILDNPLPYKKYYHYRSMKNFIDYIDCIVDIREREKMYFILDEYLELIKNTGVDNRNISQELYTNYIIPVGRLYAEDFGFMPVMRLWTISFWLSLAIIFLFILNINYLYYLLIAIVSIFFYFYSLNKRSKGKVYGFMW